MIKGLVEGLTEEIIIDVFTDGSCNPQIKIGGWASLIFIKDEKIILQGKEFNTTHNRMELQGAIKSLEYIKNKFLNYDLIRIHSDSQYLCGLFERKEKLVNSGFLKKKGMPVQNAEMVKKIIFFIESMKICFIKEIAHQKKSNNENFNREVDKISRSVVRKYIAENYT